MWGGPSHLDTFDPKPDAPDEVRGEFDVISTRTPGLYLSEHFERLATLTDRVAIVRSFTHDDPAHLSSAHTLLTGHLPPVNKSDDEPPSERDTPHLGAMFHALRPTGSALPSAVTMPWQAYHPSAPGGTAPGQHGGWLGRSADPMLITGDPSEPNWQVPALELLDGVDVHRLNRREELLARIDEQRHALDSMAALATSAYGMAAGIGDHVLQQSRAFELLASSDVHAAFDLTQETDETRDRYGRHVHGQCVLLARRLVESGVPFVNVNWHNDGEAFWDTHGDNFRRLKRDLIPPADRALSALIEDLETRGMLEDTLIVWVGEFGRKPQITRGNAGREHWPFCFSGLFAGGGIRGGTIYGASDDQGGYPVEHATSPHAIAATVLHAMGVPENTTLQDRASRPHPLYADRPLTDLFT